MSIDNRYCQAPGEVPPCARHSPEDLPGERHEQNPHDPVTQAERCTVCGMVRYKLVGAEGAVVEYGRCTGGYAPVNEFGDAGYQLIQP